jgi:hypothetical protein
VVVGKGGEGQVTLGFIGDAREIHHPKRRGSRPPIHGVVTWLLVEKDFLDYFDLGIATIKSDGIL